MSVYFISLLQITVITIPNLSCSAVFKQKISSQDIGVIDPLSSIDYLNDAKPTIEHNDDCDQEYSCTNCSTVKICRRQLNGTFRKVFEYNCDKDRPYCDAKSGTCVKSSDKVECRPISSKFDCPSDGYFPDPLDCKKHYICVRGVAYEGDCGLNFYNAKSENCHHTTACYTINCAGKSGVKVAYENDKAFFGYCFNETLVMFDRCPGKYKLDADKQKCVPSCTEEGYHGDPFDYGKYYKCSYETSALTLTITHNHCDQLEIFDSVYSRCVPKALKSGQDNRPANSW